jgi:hypothetical protein
MGNELVPVRPVGRPSSFNPAIAAYICEQLAIGRSLIAICEEKLMPDRETVNRWGKKYPDFAAAIAGAREDQADYFLDKQIEISENANAENWQLKKFQADNLKWVAAKLKPKKYGDKQDVAVTHTGAVGVITADLPSLCRLIAEASGTGTSIEIQGDVPSGSVLPPEIRTE